MRKHEEEMNLENKEFERIKCLTSDSVNPNLVVVELLFLVHDVLFDEFLLSLTEVQV